MRWPAASESEPTMRSPSRTEGRTGSKLGSDPNFDPNLDSAPNSNPNVQAQRAFQRGLQRLAFVLHALSAAQSLPRLQVRMDHAALDGTRPHDRHLDHQVVENLRLQPRQHGHLRTALDLEHAHRIGAADHV